MDSQKRLPETLKPLKFSELGVRERQDLEEWIKTNPDILGTKLLIITTEYNRFYKSDKRLDILALDENGKLVVVELKRDVSRSLADLQAIRYAAFCSQMTLPQLVQERAKYAKTDIEQAEQEIQDFVSEKPLTKLDNKPRIIIAAGSFDDQELMSCVLWLRNFKVDITCVEIAPYKAPKDDRLILVPRIIVPLPEAHNYIVGIENKEASQGELSPLERQYLERNDQILKQFRTLMPDRAPQKAWAKNFMQIPTGHGGVHFEWWQHGRGQQRVLDVALHCESSSRERNLKLCEFLRRRKNHIKAFVGEMPTFQPKWGEKWTAIYYRKPAEEWNDGFARWAAERMAKFVASAQPLLDEFYKRG